MLNRRRRTIELLSDSIQLEYRAVFLYRIHARAIRNQEVKQRLLEFGEMESQHATLVGEKLTELDGTIAWTYKPEDELHKPVRQILEEHGAWERQAIAVYQAALDEHLGREYDLLFARLLRDEKYHQRVLAELLAQLPPLRSRPASRPGP